MSAGILIFDFDGTVADTTAAIMGSAAAAFDALGHDVELTGAESTIGLSLEELFRHAVPDADEDLLAELVAAYRADFAVHGIGRSAPFPGVTELIDDLSGNGVPRALATARSRNTLEPLLGAFGLEGSFDPVMTHSDVSRPKPHPEMILTACAQAGVEPGRSIMIGDTTFDVEMGIRAGATTCAVTWGNHSAEMLAACAPDHMVDSVAELGALLLGGSAGR